MKEQDKPLEPGLTPAPVREPLAPEALRERCDPNSLPFNSTAEVEEVHGVIGQDAAVEALRFGLEIHAPGQNIFVRGLTGTGRMTLISRLLEEIRLACPQAKDRCYVHHFAEPDRPRLITLPRGQGRVFRRRVDELADFIRDDLEAALKSEGLQARRDALQKEAQRRTDKIVKPFEQSLGEAGLSLASLQTGPVAQAVLFPVVAGKPVPPEEWEQLRSTGKITEEQAARVRKNQDELQPKLRRLMEEVNEIRRQLADKMRSLNEQVVRSILCEFVHNIELEFAQPEVHAFLAELLEDAATSHTSKEGDADPTRPYRVNVLLSRGDDDSCPIVIEDTPTVRNLLGTIDQRMEHGELSLSDHLMVRAGSLLRADGGYLILDAHDLLRDPSAWLVLVRTLRTGRIEIAGLEQASAPWGPSLKPQPIDVNIKVILLGGGETYHLLDSNDPDFPHLFKVLADFDSVIPRNDEAIAQYGGVLARIVKENNHPPFDRTAVAALVEHGSRIAGRKDRLTTRFGRLADVAHEAAFIAGKARRAQVIGDDVVLAIRRSKERAGLPSRQFQELLADGTIRVVTTGAAIGQVNGLAVSHLGPLTFGFPTRITATIGPGSAGVINIEREAELSGAIHTKGFYILGGLLRYLLPTGHPLTFHASIAFEQSYGGIDGDSASAAEMCCLLSALTDIPLRQDIAITGAIDQVGQILAVGATNEKIEGFFDTCNSSGLTGSQGVILPKGNARDLMLRTDVVDACKAGRFHVYTVDRLPEALELLTGVQAGRPDQDGAYPDDSLLGVAVMRAFEYWVRASQTAGQLEWQADASADETSSAGD